jgi:hypothetical protein
LATLLLAKSPSPPFAGYLNEFGGDMPSVLAAFLLLAITVAAQTTQPVSEQPQPGGTITGTVTNDDGEPIQGASLCTEVTYEHGSGTSCGRAQTDARGQFSIRVPLGEIGIYAQKTDGGYWPRSIEMRMPKTGRMIGIKTVTLTHEVPTATVKLKIGPRPATLKFEVKHKSTGKPVEMYHVRWIGVDNAMMNAFEGPAPRDLAIPPGVDVIVTIHAEGYRRWFYLDPSTSQPTLRLASGEVKELDVELEPEEKN